MLDSKLKVENLMNLVMQFRKVCNHPELFERKDVRTPFLFLDPYVTVDPGTVPFGSIKEIFPNLKNPINY
jgi:DNA helicase INO80